MFRFRLRVTFTSWALPVADVGTLVCGDVAHLSLHTGVALSRKSILLQVD